MRHAMFRRNELFDRTVQELVAGIAEGLSRGDVRAHDRALPVDQQHGLRNRVEDEIRAHLAFDEGAFGMLARRDVLQGSQPLARDT